MEKTKTINTEYGELLYISTFIPPEYRDKMDYFVWHIVANCKDWHFFGSGDTELEAVNNVKKILLIPENHSYKKIASA